SDRMDTRSATNRQVASVLPFRNHHPSELGQLPDTELHLPRQPLLDIRLRKCPALRELEDRREQKAAGTRL
ncbi:hypothetical protein AAVH_37207, partial [Aphelenchoides avenae]